MPAIHSLEQSDRIDDGRLEASRQLKGERAGASTRYGFNHSLNGYRGLCALLVFFFHSGNAGVISTQHFGIVTDFLWTSLRYGVEMFFTISGYVILGSLARHVSIVQFLNDRFIRIYSAWLPALLSVSLVCALFHVKMFANTSAVQGIELFVVNLALLPPLVSVPLVHMGSWSLTYEWIFYLSAALGAALFRARASESRWAIGIWALLSATFVCLFPRSTFFLTGVLVFQNAEWIERRRQWLRYPLLSMLIFLVAWRYTQVDEAALSITYLDFLSDYRWLAALIAFAASLHSLASVVHRGSRQLAFLDQRLFQFFGNVSYSFYLWHTLVMSAVKRVVTPYLVPHVGVSVGFIVFVVASGAISLAISHVSWQVFEVRLARAARRFLTSTRADVVARAAE